MVHCTVVPSVPKSCLAQHIVRRYSSDVCWFHHCVRAEVLLLYACVYHHRLSFVAAAVVTLYCSADVCCYCLLNTQTDEAVSVSGEDSLHLQTTTINDNAIEAVAAASISDVASATASPDAEVHSVQAGAVTDVLSR
jgi:hypothetical protein